MILQITILLLKSTTHSEIAMAMIFLDKHKGKGEETLRRKIQNNSYGKRQRVQEEK